MNAKAFDAIARLILAFFVGFLLGYSRIKQNIFRVYSARSRIDPELSILPRVSGGCRDMVQAFPGIRRRE